MGSTGGIVSGIVSITGGILTLCTLGAGFPVLMAGLGIGIACSLTHGGASIAKCVIQSKEMKQGGPNDDDAADVDIKQTEFNREKDKMTAAASMSFLVVKAERALERDKEVSEHLNAAAQERIARRTGTPSRTSEISPSNKSSKLVTEP